jgi:hypothetical protein
MLKAYAHFYSQWTGSLADLEALLHERRKSDGDGAPVVGAIPDIPTTVRWLDQLREPAVGLRMRPVVTQIDMIRGDLTPDTPLLDAAVWLAELRRRLVEELAHRRFVYVAPNDEDYFNPVADWHLVWDAFRTTIDDTQEAGKCLALGRPTASVMHLMRVLEVGLRAMATSLEVNGREWGELLQNIEAELKRRRTVSPMPPGWPEVRQFYSEAATQFRYFKDAWRNEAMHARSQYTVAEAAEIYGAVRAFMHHIATRLKEPDNAS